MYLFYFLQNLKCHTEIEKAEKKRKNKSKTKQKWIMRF